MVRIYSSCVAHIQLKTLEQLPRSYAVRLASTDILLTMIDIYQELDDLARNWIKPQPEAVFTLRVPLEHAAIHAAVSFQRDFHTISVAHVCLKVLATGPYIYVGSGSYLSPDGSLNIYSKLTCEDVYQIVVMGEQGLRVEIVVDDPPPPDEPL